MAGVFPSDTSIFIVNAGTNASAITASDKISGEITNWSLSGGEQDVESIPVIGGFVDKEMPRGQFEVSFDVIIQDSTAATLDRWDSFKYGSSTAYSSALEASAKAIFIDFAPETGTKKSIGMNNCKGVTWEPEMAADDMLRGTMTFKFSPTTPTGSANLITSAVTASTLPNWA